MIKNVVLDFYNRINNIPVKSVIIDGDDYHDGVNVMETLLNPEYLAPEAIIDITTEGLIKKIAPAISNETLEDVSLFNCSYKTLADRAATLESVIKATGRDVSSDEFCGACFYGNQFTKPTDKWKYNQFAIAVAKNSLIMGILYIAMEKIEKVLTVAIDNRDTVSIKNLTEASFMLGRLNNNLLIESMDIEREMHALEEPIDIHKRDEEFIEKIKKAAATEDGHLDVTAIKDILDKYIDNKKNNMLDI